MEPNNIDKNIADSEGDRIDTGIAAKGERSAASEAAGASAAERMENEFESIWAAYPQGRKQGRLEALAAYKQARRNGTGYQQVLDGLDAYKRQLSLEQTPARYIKQGGTWFRNEGWRDEYVSAPQQAEKLGASLEKWGTPLENRRTPSEQRGASCGTNGSGRSINRALAYPQHSYTKEQLMALGVDFGEDVYKN